MKLSVYFTPLAVTPQVVQGRPVLVIDILRATTTMVTALANGARSVVPAESSDDAIRIAQNLEPGTVLLAGEKKLERIEGFALGNSPLEMKPEVVRGKTIVMSTTNGTPALVAAGSGAPVLVAAATNFSAVVEAARAAFEERGEIVIVCSGRERMFALDDAYAAGRYTQALVQGRGRGVELNDAAIAARELVRRYGDKWRTAIMASAAARALKQAGYQKDVDAAIEFDSFPVVPLYSNRLVSVPH